ncbi:major facilitator superfamily domain-containing protein [Aspergillus transmontanensis]|uniref:Major facilitator superfamily domain-containing protein n=1 Tax=Aspergillus transmontanensis TaxID=1034304 RepID=A0A5N6VS56_9EURO|nr:major facilitator superfamily domain-containing protein [Aspergillus transmontanensis]
METEKSQSSPPVVQSQDTQGEAPVYCAFSERDKRGTIFIASMIAFLAPISGSIYYPALIPLSESLHVSKNTINLTITVYMIFQGFAPLLTASYSDHHGRRPVFLVCLVVYIGVNVGLCLQTNIAALFVLRCLQSVGSSGVSIVATATIADMVTRAERAKYMVYSSMGYTLGPAIGPVLGGLLTQFLGWRSIFIFLTIVAAVLVIVCLAFLPETCRAVVGNGSVVASPWNRSGLQWLRLLSPSYDRPMEDRQTLLKLRRRPSLWDSILLVRHKPTGILVFASTMISCGFIAVLTSIPFLFQARYNFNALEIGLCYLPYAVGGLASRWSFGTLSTRNFKRCAREAGVTLVKNKQSPEQLRKIPLEKARLQLTLPLLCISVVLVVVYGWLLQAQVHVAGPLVLLFFLGNAVTGMRNSLNALVVDLNAQRPATASASLNFFRSILGAGVAAAVVPMIDAIGIGWTSTVVGGVWLVVSPVICVVYRYGRAWRVDGDML